MHVEDVHEDGNLHSIFTRFRIRALFNFADTSVHRTHDGPRIFRRFASRIPEKLESKHQEHEEKERDDSEVKHPAHDDGDQSSRENRPAFTGNDRMGINAVGQG